MFICKFFFHFFVEIGIGQLAISLGKVSLAVHNYHSWAFVCFLDDNVFIVAKVFQGFILFFAQIPMFGSFGVKKQQFSFDCFDESFQDGIKAFWGGPVAFVFEWVSFNFK